MENPKQIKIRQLNKKAITELFKILPKIKMQQEAKHFFQDLFSSAEIKDIARRLAAAKLLHQGKTYQEIEDYLGMGPLTINKIHFKTKGSKILPKLFGS